MADESTNGEQQCPVMTTNSGRPVGDNQNSVTVGPRGPVLMGEIGGKSVSETSTP